MQKNPVLPEYLQQVSAGPVLEYGECFQVVNVQSGIKFLRGYKNALGNVNGDKCSDGKNNWANPVVYTPGMVNPHLLFNNMGDDGSVDMYDVVIQKLNERCDNKNFDQWFVDDPTVNKRVNMVLELPKSTDESNDFVYNFNSNNGGFFPLDSVNPVSHEWVSAKTMMGYMSFLYKASNQLPEPEELKCKNTDSCPK